MHSLVKELKLLAKIHGEHNVTILVYERASGMELQFRPHNTVMVKKKWKREQEEEEEENKYDCGGGGDRQRRQTEYSIRTVMKGCYITFNINYLHLVSKTGTN